MHPCGEKRQHRIHRAVAVRVQLYLGAQATTEAQDAGKQRELRVIRRKQWAQPSGELGHRGVAATVPIARLVFGPKVCGELLRLEAREFGF